MKVSVRLERRQSAASGRKAVETTEVIWWGVEEEGKGLMIG